MVLLSRALARADLWGVVVDLASHVRAVAFQSVCPRSRVGALLVDELTGAVLASAFNAPVTPCAALCGVGGRECTRDALALESGTQNDIGCLHAEYRLIWSARARDLRVEGRHVWVSRTPCDRCCLLLREARVGAITILERPSPRLWPPLWELARAGVRIFTKG